MCIRDRRCGQVGEGDGDQVSVSIHFEMYKILLFPVEQCTTDIIFRMLQHICDRRERELTAGIGTAQKVQIDLDKFSVRLWHVLIYKRIFYDCYEMCIRDRYEALPSECVLQLLLWWPGDADFLLLEKNLIKKTKIEMPGSNTF